MHPRFALMFKVRIVMIQYFQFWICSYIVTYHRRGQSKSNFKEVACLKSTCLKSRTTMNFFPTTPGLSLENVGHQKSVKNIQNGSSLDCKKQSAIKMKQKYSSSVNLKPADIHDCCVTDHQASSFLFLMRRIKMRT